jgi:hypothetical protein
MKIEKKKVVDVLRRRGQHDRAEWVNRELPDLVDSAQNTGILATLGLTPADLADPTPDDAHQGIDTSNRTN